MPKDGLYTNAVDKSLAANALSDSAASVARSLVVTAPAPPQAQPPQVQEAQGQYSRPGTAAGGAVTQQQVAALFESQQVAKAVLELSAKRETTVAKTVLAIHVVLPSKPH